MKIIFIPLCLFLILFTSCDENKIKETTVITLAETSKSWDGKTLPKYPDGNPKVTILKIIIPPKTKLKLHKHPEINAGILLKGELTVISEHNDTLNLSAGDPIVELVNTWHYGINNGNEPSEIVVFYAGIENMPITVLKELKQSSSH